MSRTNQTEKTSGVGTPAPLDLWWLDCRISQRGAGGSRLRRGPRPVDLRRPSPRSSALPDRPKRRGAAPTPAFARATGTPRPRNCVPRALALALSFPIFTAEASRGRLLPLRPPHRHDGQTSWRGRRACGGRVRLKGRRRAEREHEQTRGVRGPAEQRVTGRAEATGTDWPAARPERAERARAAPEAGGPTWYHLWAFSREAEEPRFRGPGPGPGPRPRLGPRWPPSSVK